MRRMHYGRARLGAAAGVVVLAAATLAMAGAADPDGGKAKSKAKVDPPKAEETVSDLAYLSSAGSIRVEGVGLVIGLAGTGSNPEPSSYREKLLDQMRKAQVADAEGILESPDTSLVIVRATIPTGVGPADRFDVDVELTPASATQSLQGGFLMLTRLSEVRLAGGGQLTGQTLASAVGPVMIGSDAEPDNPKAGRVLGGGKVKVAVPFLMLIKENRQSGRTAKMIEAAVNRRFHRREGVKQVGLATAKSDKHLDLDVPAVYHNNQGRYFQVIKQMPLVDAPDLRAARLEQWSRELLDPTTAGIAALRLEGIGRNAATALKAGLESDDAQVKFFAAEALAYLGDPGGVDVLAETATTAPEFRAFALAALAAMDHPAAALRLAKLFESPEIELRIGAFNALRVADPTNSSLGRVRVLRGAPAPEPDAADEMAMQIDGVTPRAARPEPRREDPFELYIVDCEGPPLVHVARSRRCEIVVFGRGQRLLPPLVLGGAGPILLNASEYDQRVQISRVDAGRLELAEQTVTAPLDLGAVICEAANLGASYPEILAMLQAASKQKNLAGALVVDKLPDPSPVYDEAQLRGQDAVEDDPAVKRAGYDDKEGRRGLFRRLRDRMSR